MFTGNRNELRRFYVDAWNQARAGSDLEPLQRLVVDVIEMHPEYHADLEDSATILDRDYTPESGRSNPFLHMGMHIAIQEQVRADRPCGVSMHYHRLVTRLGDAHRAEHQIMELLGEMLWEAQRNNVPPDERHYLARIAHLAGQVPPSTTE
jgi:hypothetical protein